MEGWSRKSGGSLEEHRQIGRFLDARPGRFNEEPVQESAAA
jgi:hypothetical protein